MSIENVKEFTEQGIFGEPIEWNGLLLYPIKMKDREKLNVNIHVLDVEKNKLGDLKIIQMSYILFLLTLMESDESVTEAFVWIIEKVLGFQYNEDLRVKDFPPNALLSKVEGDKKFFLINGWEIAFEVEGTQVITVLGETRLNATEFDELRRVILYHNIDEFDDSPMSEDFRKVIEQYYSLKNKGIVPPTLEKKMLVVITTSGETIETIKEMPCRQFDRLFSVCVDKEDYVATKPLSPYLKSPVDHWVYKKTKDKWGEIFSSTDDFMKPDIN